MSIEVEELEVFYVEPSPPPLAWGWYLGAGIAWFVIGLGVLSWHPATIALIGFAIGSVVILAGIVELGLAFVAPAWRWLHAIAGAFFIAVGVMAFLNPFHTFVSLGMLFGWYLIVKGAVVMTVSLATREAGSLWGLGVAVGVIDMIIGLWAIGYPGRSAWLLVLWVGIGAVLHGIGDIVTAFEVRAAR